MFSFKTQPSEDRELIFNTYYTKWENPATGFVKFFSNFYFWLFCAVTEKNFVWKTVPGYSKMKPI